PASSTPPSWVTGSPAAGGRAPVGDGGRPGGAPAAPPTTWPSPHLAEAPAAPHRHRRTGRALVAFTAFLLGAAMVGAAFASYAAGRGDRAGTGERAGSSTTTTAPLRADGPLDIQRVLDIIRPSVVTIQTGSPNSLFGGAGSGVIISEDGLILTNAHVIEGAGGSITIRYSDGTTSTASLVGASTSDDIALVQADRADLTPATLGSSANLLVGDPVVAIGNALNLGGDPSVTSGIVSAKDRAIDDGTIALDHLIQTDAAINPGNSGGPLVNADGHVVGINTAIIQGAQNIGFSIAIDSVKDLIEELKAGGGDLTADTAILGVSSIDVDSPDLDQSVKDELGITASTGAVVTAVDPDSAAGAAGIQEGDVIVEIDGQAVDGSGDATSIVRSHQPGDQVDVVLERRGQRQTLSVTLGP
ncbi:MAG: trypsin-like peptidase domain-containing protein, partial [Acidimicrobiales bacterium]|nr:trypsin-like peptidase domain-containing protein [Acidimicrobiales bacterium]